MKDANSTQVVDLQGVWSLAQVGGTDEVPITIPGDGITALVEAGQLPDPYWGRNEYDCRWVAERDWVIRRAFDLADPSADLVIEGLDCVAEVRINGVLLLEAANAFRVYRIDLSQAAKPGTNEIKITFRSSVEAAAKLQAEQPFYIPFSKNCPIPNGSMLRKPACDFGWDWNIALAPFGINEGVRIEPHAPVRFDHIRVSQSHTNTAAKITVDVGFVAQDAGEWVLRAELCGQVAEVPVTHAAGAECARVVLTVKNPELWWPNGQGEQTLHDLTIALGDATEIRRIGLRDINLVSEPDDIGRSFKIQVNGQDMFCKGANWIPADALSGRITKEATRDLLQSAVDANMNMIRIWGGGRYEPNWFYDLCDELGLMVWQDAMFACNLYPADKEFLAEVDREIRETALRLNHHPSIALWCGDNELIGALTWYPESLENRDRYLVAYDRLNRTIETALTETLPDANWWPSSPSPGPMSFGDAWHDDTSGDMHFWSVWHEGRDFDHYRDVSPRFCSEFGFQSYPSMDVVKTFADPDDWNIASPVMESHQKNAGGNARIAETMFRYFRFPETFEDFVYLSQVQQGLAIETAVTAWRADKPRCMGTLYWQLNDTWPVASWASLDYGGGWKLLHHLAKRFYEPLHVSVVPNEGGFDCIGVNDRSHPAAVGLVIEALDMDGTARPLAEVTGEIPVDRALRLARIDVSEVLENEILHLTWTDAAGQVLTAHFAPKPYKAYALRNPQTAISVEHTGATWALTLTAKALALYAAVEADQPGRFSENAVLLRPGHPKTLTFTPQNSDGPEPKFLTRDLYTATHRAA